MSERAGVDNTSLTRVSSCSKQNWDQDRCEEVWTNDVRAKCHVETFLSELIQRWGHKTAFVDRETGMKDDSSRQLTHC